MTEVEKIFYAAITGYKPIDPEAEISNWRNYYVGKNGFAIIFKNTKMQKYHMMFIECEFKGDKAYTNRMLTTSEGDLFINEDEYTLWTHNSIYNIKAEHELKPGEFDSTDPLFKYKCALNQIAEMIL